MILCFSVNIDVSTVTVSKTGRHHVSHVRAPDTDTCPEFAVPGVPQIRHYRDNKDSHKKQRKYGPIPPDQGPGPGVPGTSGVVTRQQHNSGSRHRYCVKRNTN